MARDAIARQYDVDAASVKSTPVPAKVAQGSYFPGTIYFVAKKGKSIDLDKMYESITATRLSGGTDMGMVYLEITATGTVFVRDKDLVLKVAGTGQEFVLSVNPTAKEALERLRKAVDGKTKVTSVTGHVQGWSGRFPEVLKAWAKSAGQKRVLAVTDFEVGKD